MSVHGILGESTDYPKSYDPTILYAIPRALGREAIAMQKGDSPAIALHIGMDWWHAFEVSWLNSQGISKVAVARFSIPADSPNIVESKSLKLYLNSLNFSQFADKKTLQQTIANDLAKCVGAKVNIELMDVADSDDRSGLLITTPEGRCLDTALDNTNDNIALVKNPDASLLNGSNDAVANKLPYSDTTSDNELNTNTFTTNTLKTYKWYSNLLRSNCPVTNQPDWGTLAIEMTTHLPVNEANLLKYILSFRQHNGFHEQCVEQVYADLTDKFQPIKLMVRAWYTRRGGIDINPCRVSELSLLPKPSRLIRQ